MAAALPASAVLAQGWVTFTNETSSRLVAAPGLGANDPEEKDFAQGDFDQDGDVDLIVVRKQPFTTPNGKRNVLLMNEGGVLVDRTVEYATAADDGGQGFLDITNDRDVVVADFNNDGWLDFATCPALNQNLPKTISHPRIYMNLGVDENGDWLGFRYEEARIPQLPQAPNGCGIAAGDVTGDGFADIYIVDYLSTQEDRLLINDGNGFFTDETLLRMTPQMIASGFGTSGAIVDFNGDGVLDIAKSENGPFKISYNDPNNEGFFNKHETASAGAHYGMSVGDLNNDDMIDVVIGDDGNDRYLLNLGPGADGMANFQTKTYSFLSGGDDGFGNNSRVVDLNNDGWNDVLQADVDVDIGGCSRRLHLYRNLGNAPSVTLQDQGTGGIPTGALTGTHDVAVIDLDGDGWKDLVLGRCSGISIWMNQPPVGMVVAYPQGLPAFVTPDQSYTFQVQISVTGVGELVEESATLHVDLNDGNPPAEITLVPLGDGLYQAALPAMACTQTASWWVSAELSPGGTFTDPPSAPDSTYTALAALGTDITLRDELEEGTDGWTVTSEPTLTGGEWVAVDPIGTVTAGSVVAPEDDATADVGVIAFVTGNGVPGGAATLSDVDGGPTHLDTPIFDLEGQDGLISFAAWFFCDDLGTSQADVLLVSLSNDGGETWTPVMEIDDTAQAWQVQFLRVSDHLEPTSAMRVRFTANDTPNNSLTEAGIDNFQVETILCGSACPADFDGNGFVDGADLGVVLGAWGEAGGPADLTGDGMVDGADLGALLGAWGGCS